MKRQYTKNYTENEQERGKKKVHKRFTSPKSKRFTFLRALSKKQREVYDNLSKDHMTVKQIAKSRNLTTRAIYKTIKILKEKGYLLNTYIPTFKDLQHPPP